jgi:hypothetical protein
LLRISKNALTQVTALIEQNLTDTERKDKKLSAKEPENLRTRAEAFTDAGEVLQTKSD